METTETTFGEDDARYSALYGNEIIRSIPPGSVYFCGMNPGPFVMEILEKTKMNGEPFFVVAQDALSDARYFNYVRKTYGEKLGLPTPEESEQFCSEYYADIQKRLEERRLKSGKRSQAEAIELDSGKVLFVGDEDLKRNHPVVMHLNGLLARIIFDKNPNKSFYIEVSFPLEWMNPHLEPHGLILKINREPMAKLSREMIQQNHDYWKQITSPMISDWVNDKTSIQEIAAFAEKVYLRNDFSDFHGDTNFVRNTYWQRKFSNNLSSIADLYAWRARQGADADNKRRMNDAADFAFRQAWALCPYGTNAVVRYVSFLMAEKRTPEAIVVAETASRFRSQPIASQSGFLANQIDQMVSNLKGLGRKA